MNFFKRLFKIGEAEANAAIDNMEDPIKMTEQGIRDMKNDLEKSIEALAQVKAMAIRTKNDTEEAAAKADDYQQKAMLILKKAHNGTLDTAEADRLAKEALIKKEAAAQQVESRKQETEKYERTVSQLEKNVHDIKQNISRWENELKTLKARVKVASATKNVSKQMAAIDSASTVAMLERMKEKVQQEEAIAEAYGDIANASQSIDSQLDEAINATETSAEEELSALKKQLGLDS